MNDHVPMDSRIEHGYIADLMTDSLMVSHMLSMPLALTRLKSSRRPTKNSSAAIS